MIGWMITDMFNSAGTIQNGESVSASSIDSPDVFIYNIDKPKAPGIIKLKENKL